MKIKDFPYIYREYAFDTKHPDVSYGFGSLSDYGIKKKGNATAYYINKELAGISLFHKGINIVVANDIGNKFLQDNSPEKKYLKNRPLAISETVESLKGDVIYKGTPCFNENSAIYKKIAKEFGKYSEGIHKQLCNDMIPIPLTHINPNVFKAAAELNIDELYFEQFRYKDPYYDYKHYGLVPVIAFLRPENGQKYQSILKESLSSFSSAVIFDNDKDDIFFQNLCKMDTLFNNKSITIPLGGGYTECTLPSDGDVSTQAVLLKFEDFHLVCMTHFWLNK